MSEQPGQGAAALKVRQPSLQDYLLSRRPDTRAIVQRAKGESHDSTGDGEQAAVQPDARLSTLRARSDEREASGERAARAADGRRAVPVEHVGVTLIRDAERLRYHIYDRLMHDL